MSSLAIEFSHTKSQALFTACIATSCVSAVMGIALVYFGAQGPIPTWIYSGIAFWGIGMGSTGFAFFFRNCSIKKVQPSPEEVLATQAKLEELKREKNTLREQKQSVLQDKQTAHKDLESVNTQKELLELEIAKLEKDLPSYKEKVQSLSETNIKFQRKLSSLENETKTSKEVAPIQQQQLRESESNIQKAKDEQARQNQLLKQELERCTALASHPPIASPNPSIKGELTLKISEAILFMFHFETLKAKEAKDTSRQEMLSNMDPKKATVWTEWMHHPAFSRWVTCLHLKEPFVKINPSKIEEKDVEIALAAACLVPESSLIDFFSKKMAALIDRSVMQIKTKEEYEKYRFTRGHFALYLEYIIKHLKCPLALAAIEKNNPLKGQALIEAESAWTNFCANIRYHATVNDVAAAKANLKLSWQNYYYSLALEIVDPKPFNDHQALCYSLFGNVLKRLTLGACSFRDQDSVLEMNILLVKHFIPHCPNVERIALNIASAETISLISKFPKLTEVEFNMHPLDFLPVLEKLKIKTAELNVTLTLREIIELQKRCPTLQNFKIKEYFFRGVKTEKPIACESFHIILSGFYGVVELSVLKVLNYKNAKINKLILELNDLKTLEANCAEIKESLKDSPIKKVRFQSPSKVIEWSL